MIIEEKKQPAPAKKKVVVDVVPDIPDLSALPVEPPPRPPAKAVTKALAKVARVNLAEVHRPEPVATPSQPIPIPTAPSIRRYGTLRIWTLDLVQATR